ncbi:MAG: formyl transferase [Hyphomicrobiales bacterium]|nr:MAG: formyl transferase [Hyphomicrobiales bacterium]
MPFTMTLSRVSPDSSNIAAPRIVVLATGSPLSRIFVTGLRKRFPDLVVLREEPEGKWAITRRRARLLGWPQALGQAAFGVASRLIAKQSAARFDAILKSHGLDPAAEDVRAWQDVGSVNSLACRAALKALAPDVVLVYGTRIIRRETLRAVDVPFINYHAGFNPLYRGQHGAYWARTVGDDAHAGLTVHLVDEGVDTGDVLYQAVSAFDPADNITTYQYRQMADAIPLVIRAAEDALAGRLAPKRVALPSKQWFLPTLWGYCFTGLAKGVW